MRLGGLGVLVLGLMPLAALASVPLEATLRWQEPALLNGLVTIGGLDGRNHLHASLVDPEPIESFTIMSVGRGALTIRQFVEYVHVPGRLPEPGILCDYCPSEKTITNVAVAPAVFRPESQVAITDTGGLPQENPANFTLANAQCAVTNPREQEWNIFPRDPNQVGTSRDFGAVREQLAAECSADRLRAERPVNFLVYGIDVWLTSTEDGRQLVKTGTFTDEDPRTHVPRRVTQYLEIRDVDGTARVELPWKANVSIRSRTFQAAGTLQAPSGDGVLVWSDQRFEGAIDAFQADGTFRFGWTADQAVHVDGETLNGPLVASSVSSSPAFTWPLVVTYTTGFALLGLLVRLVWLLFTRVPSDRVLEHPRRAQIMEVARTEPGIEMSRVARQLEMPWVKVAYHARALERAGLLLVRRVAGRRVLLAANAGLADRAEQLVLLRRDTHRRLWQTVRDNPGIDRQALAARLGITAARVSQTGRVLEAAGLVNLVRAHRRMLYYARPEVQV